ncbi:MAG: hypothetical protein CL925_14480 [Deltaproteobacteria bacterium]|nr:hypothetical protein [Deltaproteobacteria bacterium]
MFHFTKNHDSFPDGDVNKNREYEVINSRVKIIIIKDSIGGLSMTFLYECFETLSKTKPVI